MHRSNEACDDVDTGDLHSSEVTTQQQHHTEKTTHHSEKTAMSTAARMTRNDTLDRNFVYDTRLSVAIRESLEVRLGKKIVACGEPQHNHSNTYTPPKSMPK